MSETCDAIRTRLVELLYGEVDPDTERQVRLHLEACPNCRERMEAFQRVRTDLDEWETEEVPPRIAFVGLPPWRRATSSVWTRRLAVAASFILGIVVTGALVNLEIERTADGWTARTGLLPRAAASSPETPVAGTGPASGTRQASAGDALRSGAQSSPPGEVRFISPVGREILPEADFERLLDTDPRGRLPGRPGSGARLTQGQRAEIRDLLTRVLSEQEARFREDLRDLVAASEMRQQHDYSAALATVYELLQAQHQEDLVALTGQLGLVEADTDDQLQRTHAAIDYLLRRVSDRGDQQDRPERR